MEFREVLRRRRMVRHYRPEPVPDEVLRRIVAAGVSAPSAGFSQGQSFVVVTDRRRRTEIARLASEPEHVARGLDPWLSSAPAHIMVCASEQRYVERYSDSDKSNSARPTTGWPVPYWWLDAGASMMAILLATADEGLAAGFLGVHAIPGLGDLLGLPTDQHPIGVITVGFPAPDRRSGSLLRGRLPDSDVVHWQRWGGRESDGFNPNPAKAT